MGEMIEGGMGAFPRSPFLHDFGSCWKTGEVSGKRERRRAALEGKRVKVCSIGRRAY